MKRTITVALGENGCERRWGDMNDRVLESEGQKEVVSAIVQETISRIKGRIGKKKGSMLYRRFH